MTLTSVGRVLLSVQRALLGAVTSDLRAVAVRCTPTRIDGRFVYDSGADVDSSIEIVQEVATLVIADQEDYVEVEFVAEFLSGAVDLVLERDEIWAFLRREDARRGPGDVRVP